MKSVLYPKINRKNKSIFGGGASGEVAGGVQETHHPYITPRDTIKVCGLQDVNHQKGKTINSLDTFSPKRLHQS